jgi:hypothetical protein
MRTFLISYDLARPNRNKHALATEIMSLGRGWARPLEQTWFLKSDASESEIETRLAPLLDVDDGLLIQSVEEQALLTNTSLRWFRQRQPGIDIEAGGNVIAFPAKQTPSAEPELPFAQAS